VSLARRHWLVRLLLAGGLIPPLAGGSPLRAATTRFAPVLPGTRLTFPRDHGAHPEFRIEWWYLTGWLDTPAAQPERAVGVQITFFRLATGWQRDHASRFAARQLLFAHAALAIPGRGRLITAERVARAGLGLAEASDTDTNLSIGDWRLSRDSADRYQARIVDPALTIDLTLQAHRPPLLQGELGFSRKGPSTAQASYYYSRPWLEATGRISVPAAARALPMPTAGELKGPVWFDHEWSSELLDPEAQGWDWVGLHLNDGSALMAFRIRRRTGEDLWRTANWVNTAQEPLLSATQAESIRFETLRSWRSPRTSASWPVAQRLHISGRTLELQPLFDDQELQTQGSTGVTYWEGAVTVHEANRMIGRGYLELTGYAQAMRI